MYVLYVDVSVQTAAVILTEKKQEEETRGGLEKRADPGSLGIEARGMCEGGGGGVEALR